MSGPDVQEDGFDGRDAAIAREKGLKTGHGRQWPDRRISAGRMRQAGAPASVPPARIRAARESAPQTKRASP